MAQSDARPTGDQEAAGSIPVQSATFYGHSLPSFESRRAVVSFWRKNVHNVVNCLETLIVLIGPLNSKPNNRRNLDVNCLTTYN